MSDNATTPASAVDNETAITTPITVNDGTRHSNVTRFLDIMDPIVSRSALVATYKGPAYLDFDSAKLSLNILNTLSDTTRTLAETDRIEAARGYHVEQTQTKAESTSSLIVTMDTSKIQESIAAGLRLPRPKKLDMSTNAFTGRTGSISWNELESMSDERLGWLDKMLKRIVVKVCVDGITWEKVGSVVYEELVEFGFRFLPMEGYRTAVWSSVTNPRISEISRIINVVDCCTQEQSQWYSHEMLLVVRRLMEIRGFQV